MNSMKNKTRLLEKTFTDKIKNDRKTTKKRKKKHYELNKRRNLIRKQNESNKEIKQIERKRKKRKYGRRY